MMQKVVALLGGVGGAKIALGLQRILKPDQLTLIVNTADDFWHYGLRICPDLDTLMYTLSGRVDPVNGWGIADDTTQVLEGLRWYGENTWFRLGDQDIATHLIRSEMLRSGRRLTEIVADLAKRMGIEVAVLPVTDDEIATIAITQDGRELGFQEYFVKHRWQPVLHALRYEGIERARLTPEVETAIRRADVILIGPSNPWLSIEPVLAIPGMRALLTTSSARRVALTPLIQGRAVKGPTAKLMAELGYEVSALAVARFYADVIQGFVYDVRDAEIRIPGIRSIGLDTLMNNLEDKVRLAQEILNWVAEWSET